MSTAFLHLSKRDIRDSARLAIQSSAAAAVVFVSMQALGAPEKFVGILSAVLVVQPSVGDAIGEALDRIAATIVGSVVGVTAMFLLPAGYGTAVALAVSMLVMNAVAGLRPDWRYGVVAAVALSLGSENDAMQTAMERASAIGGGALVGAIASLTIWPSSATKRTSRHIASALRGAAARLDAAIDAAQGTGGDEKKKAQRGYHSNIELARRAAKGIRFGDVDRLETQIEKTEKLYNSTLILNRVAEETDQAVDGTDSYRKQIDDIRARCCEVTNNLADGDTDQLGSLTMVEETLEELRGAVGELQSDPREHVLKNALVFGLGEVSDSLHELTEAFQQEEA